jgi:hypothetical protein
LHWRLLLYHRLHGLYYHENLTPANFSQLSSSIKPTVAWSLPWSVPQNLFTMSDENLPRFEEFQAIHAYGEEILKSFHGDLKTPLDLPGSHMPMPSGQPQIGKPQVEKPPKSVNTRPIQRVAIVGAGVAGLHTAMVLGSILKHVHIDLYEAEERIGGRLYTHHFNNINAIGTQVPGAEYDYFVRSLVDAASFN